MPRILGILALLTFPSLLVGGENWPQFRGPTGDGRTEATGLPLTWGESKNVRWKTPIHDRGWSSPVVWGEQIWLTTATEDGHKVFAVCVDLQTGRVVHDLKVFDVAQPEPIHTLNSYASPTPAVEAGRVYVHFGSYGTACLDTATGKTLWERRDLKCNHFRGPGSSPVLCGDLLLLTFDGFDVQYLVAVNKATGRTVWKTDRSTDFGDLDGDLRKAYTTPLVVDHGGQQQVISSGAYAAMAYDLKTGRELWKVRYPGGYSNTVRPVAQGEIVFLNTGFDSPEMWALRLGGSGDVTLSRVLWKYAKNMPCKPSPVLADGLLYMIADGGIATCLDAATGKPVWQQRVGGQYSASPICADGRIYFFSQEGKTTVIRAGRKYEILATNTLKDGFMASPAVVGKALILRTKTHLYRIEE